MLASWNVRPQAVVGHSSGEIAAAYCAGGLSNQSAWAVAYFRGLLASRLAKESSPRSGSMMAVALSEEDIIPYLSDVNVKGYITVGCVNSSSNITVSGSVEAVDALKDLLDDQKIFARKLAVNVAYHSKQMDNIASDYLRFLRDFGLECHFSGRGSLPIMYSSVTGQAIPPGDLSHSEYWVSNMTSKVRFSDALAEMCHAYRADPSLKSERGEPPINEIVEIGPRAALRRPVKDTIGDVNYRFALEADQSATRTAMSLAGSLLCQGHDVDLMAVNSLDESKVQMLTDLPAYPFNHSQKYWHESRLSKEFRFRKFPPHELLGTQAIDWNPLMPKWRHFIKASENPWIRDHGFNGATLFPAAGMITMAIEAVRQLSTTAGTMKIANYRLKEVEFSNALVISAADEGVETEFTLRKHKISGNSSGAYEFFLYSRADEKWLKHCQGHIAVEFLQSPTTSVEDRETDETHWIGPKKFETGVNQCHLGVHSKQMYENLKNLGFDMGPAFQTLRDIKYSMEGKATATIGLSDWKSKMPEDARNIQEHVIHPTSLDGIFHLTVVAVTRGGWSPIPTMVPTYLEKLWISNDFLAEKYLKSIKAYSKSISSGYREAQFSMLAVDPDNHKVLVEAENYEATAVSSLHLTSSYESKWKRICYFIDWKPDVDFMHSDSLSSYCELASCHTAPYSGRLVDQAELVSLFYISAVLDETSHRKNPRLEASMDRYVEWMEHQHGSANTQSVLSSLDGQKILKDEDFRNDCIRSLEDSGPEGKLYVTVGQNLSAILHGEVDALDLLFHGSVLQDFYSSSFFTVNYQRMAAYVQLLAHKNPNQRVLEIGAGTGGATSSILQALGPNDPNDNHGTPRYQQYLYTDISAGFFQEAKENFKCHGDRILYKKLDIEKDPAEQGFQIGTYDLIVASCVLHATTSIDKTLQNSRKLLKEGGKLILFEPCNPESARLAFVFGLLPGWWLGAESHRRWSPLLSDELWHNELQKNGFSGNDMRLRDYEGDRHNFSVIASTATSKSQNRDFFNEITLIVSSDSSIQNDIAQEVSRKILSTLGILCKTSSMDELLTGCSEDVFYIFLPEMQHPFLNTISNKNFDKVKAMVNTSVGLLWVAVDGGLSTQRPEMGLTTGFGRSVCSENSNFKFINLSLETIASTAKVTKHILAVLRRAIQDPQMPHESEYLEKDGVLCVNRVVENNFLNDKIHSIVAHQEPQLQEFRASNGREIELTIASPGLLNTLCFIDDTAKSALASEEVEISVQAVGINFKNVMVALGQLPDKSLGQECSGLIIKLGKEVDPRKLNIGDRVCAITHGAFKTTARSHQSSVYKIPDNVSWSTAAALPVAYCTAYYALHYLARLREGESVLIHAAAGGVGQAAVQIAKTKKAKIFATVGSNSKRRLLMDSYNIPESHIFSSRNISFAKGIKEFTGDQGVDIVLNSLTGDILQESFDCIAPLGRFIEIGKRDMYTREKLSMVPFLRNITFSSVDLGIVAERAKSLMAELMTETMNLVWTANLRAPQPVHVFEVSEVEKAFRFLQSGKNAGKTVVELSNHDIVPVSR